MINKFRWQAVAPLMLAAVFACKANKESDKRVTSEVGGEAMSAPSSDSAKAHDQTLVRVVNAMPGRESVDIWAGDSSTFQNVAFKSVTAYQPITQNKPTFKVVPAGNPTAAALAENSEVVLDGRYYTAIALPAAGTDNKPAIEVLRDDLVPGDPGKARIRIVNAASSMKDKDIDVYVNGNKDALFDDVGFKSDAGYKEVDPGTAALDVKADDADTRLLRIADLKLEAGKSLTIVIVNSTAKGGKLEAIKVLDELTPANTTKPADSTKPSR
jgi:hypothetical protein